ncbi:MAG: hypothetical protein QM773_05550 [Hyphomonadaceae bacterium]
MRSETTVDAYMRAYTERPKKNQIASKRRGAAVDEPSDYSLIWDCETTTDAAQSLRFGFFQVRKAGQLIREGIFYEPAALSAEELKTLRAYATARLLDVCTAHEFRFKVLLNVGYEARAEIIGFNLGFDISRVATAAGEARGSLRGGFSFEISRNYNDPHIRVKHLSSTTALIDFAIPAGQATPRGMRRKGLKVEPHRGYFYDLRTLGAAFYSQKFTLARLAKLLGTKTQKHEGVDYDGLLTEVFLDYARADVQASWECFERIRALYLTYRLPTPLHRIQSEASIGKASFKALGISPLLECQPDLRRESFGPIMASYFGGRAEVHVRREIREILLTDFKSMYPSVNVLMGLWWFVVADGYSTSETTAATQDFINRVTLADLQNPETWRKLATLVEICPDSDILPLRTQYSEDRDALTIGLNYVSSDQPLWYPLADIVASKLLNGKAPRIQRAITFTPGPLQEGLRRLELLGNADFAVDPENEDVFKRLIDLRDTIPKSHPANQAIKITANSGSYGVFIEVNRDDAPKPEPLRLFGPDGEGHNTQTKAIEQPGRFFHPVLGTLTTGAARLMLGIGERLVVDSGLDWVFCDTDSLAIARPAAMSRAEFHDRVKAIVDWYVPLNPYNKPGSILKIEDINYRLNSQELEPLFAYAISSKRYSAFNIGADRRPIIRKFSGHGLGHLMDPYPESDPASGVPAPVQDVAKLGGRRWQYDFWFHILTAALAGKPNQVRRDYHPALLKPAMCRYGATSPALLRWMNPFNDGKAYADQVKPFGFLVALMARGDELEAFEQILDEAPKRGRPPKARKLKPIAPFERDPALAASRAFDRETGEPVPASAFKSYAAALQFYHHSPEDKFANGGPYDVGRTERRHLRVAGIRLIGKEANRVDDIGAPDAVIPAFAEFST